MPTSPQLFEIIQNENARKRPRVYVVIDVATLARTGLKAQKQVLSFIQLKKASFFKKNVISSHGFLRRAVGLK